MKSRYHQQIVLPEFGPDGQEALSRGRVVCVGVGGLGCPALQYLAASGVGELVLVDGDRVEESNLPRQILYGPQDVGALKVDVARSRLMSQNPNVKMTTRAEALTEFNALEILSGATVVVDGTDNFSTKFLINDAAVKLDIPVVWGAATGFQGQIAVFQASRGPCYRCFIPGPPRKRVRNCDQAGVLGPVPGVIGVLQAVEAIKCIVGGNLTSDVGILLTVSALDLNVFRSRVKKNPRCRCSDPQAIKLEGMDPDVCLEKQFSITQDDVNRLGKITWIDVREHGEFVMGTIPGAKNLPLSIIEKNDPEIMGLKNESHYVLFCQSGIRSLRAVVLLHELGIRSVRSLSGGYQSWLYMNQDAGRLQP